MKSNSKCVISWSTILILKQKINFFIKLRGVFIKEGFMEECWHFKVMKITCYFLGVAILSLIDLLPGKEFSFHWCNITSCQGCKAISSGMLLMIVLSCDCPNLNEVYVINFTLRSCTTILICTFNKLCYLSIHKISLC